MADDDSIYYLQQSGSTLWWAGLSLDRQLSPDYVWHRGLSFTNVFRGTINSDNTIVGEWSDVSRGLTLNSGTLTVKVDSSGGVTKLTKLTATGGFGATTWTRTDPLDDTKFNGTTLDIISRFDAVHKNNGETIHHNLKPYRDATVFYGRVVISHVDYIADNHGVESEIPHVNYDPPFAPPIPNFPNFGIIDRTYDEFFVANASDADFDMRLKVDLDRLEPEFYTTGWGDRTFWPRGFSDSSSMTLLPTRSSIMQAVKGHMGVETIMFGRNLAQDILLPGWSEMDGNSVLINGRPINGPTLSQNPAPDCDFVQPCPNLAGETPQQLQSNYLDAPAGVAFGNLILSASGNGVLDRFGIAGTGIGTYVRVTGALVLDCGHLPEHGYPCFDGDDGNPDDDSSDVSTHQNQEIHPIYSIDIINFPFRPEDILMDARKNLTGAWGGSDGSTYYIRQIGNTVWWLGQMRDRQPMQRGTNFPIIGAKQLAPAFDAGDPPCPSQQCWAFATVFKGTITESPIQTVIDGDWAGVPQSTSAGSSGGHMKFFVFNHKIIVGATPSIFPVTIEKMYEPEDTTPPVITINQPAATQYLHNAMLTLDYSVIDRAGSGVQSFTPLMDNAITVGNHGLQSGQAINLLTEMNLGQHIFTVNAIDNAGNDDSSSVTFTIVVTSDSIKEDVNQFLATGAIRNHGLANSLLAKLSAAASARAAGDCAAANNNYQAFIKQLQTQIGKGVDAAAALIMIADAQYLMAHCP